MAETTLAAEDASVITEPKQARVFVACLPRSTSSVFARCLSEVPNSQVFFDTQFFCKVAEDNLRLMGKTVDYEADDLPDEDWLKALEMYVGEDCSGQDVNLLKYPYVKKLLDNPNPDKSLILCKTPAMPVASHLQFLPDKSSNYKYVFLLRHPVKVFLSLRKGLYSYVSKLDVNVANPKSKCPPSFEEFNFMRDVPENLIFQGRLFKELYDVWVHVKENQDPNPVIIDSDDLLRDPAGMLPKFCAAVGIDYSDDLLKWEANPDCSADWLIPLRPIHHFEVGRIYCSNALYSTHFQPPSNKPTPIDDVTYDVRESVEYVMPYYQEMYDLRIKP